MQDLLGRLDDGSRRCAGRDRITFLTDFDAARERNAMVARCPNMSRRCCGKFLRRMRCKGLSLAFETPAESGSEMGNASFKQPDDAPSGTSSRPSSREPRTVRLRVWDLPTRLFHWALVIAVVGLVITGKVGGNALEWHMRLGHTVLALLAFRIVWGFAGGYWSRFASFLYGPSTLMAFLRGDSGALGRWAAGHSPTGALSVFAMLALLVAQVMTGLVADDEIATTGPLYRFVSSTTSARATFWHADVGAWLIIALVVLHIAAIVYYAVAKRQALVPAMVSGDKALTEGLVASRDDAVSRLAALVVFALAVALSGWIWSLGAATT
jgi:cytochrome b